MAPTAEEEREVSAFARRVAQQAEGLVDEIQAFLNSLDREVYDESPLIDEIVELQSGLDDAWRMLKDSIPD